MKYNFEIFIITLPRSKERTSLMVYQLERLRLSHRVFEATDGAGLSSKEKKLIEQQRDVGIYGKPFSDGEIGCMHSHMNVYEEMKRADLDCALILEDDVCITDRVADFMTEGVIKDLPSGWDIVFLAYVQRGNVNSRPSKRAIMSFWGRKKLVKGFVVGVPVQFCYHAAGYLVSREGAKKLIEKGQPLRMPADILTGSAQAMGMNVYTVSKPIIRQHHSVSLESTIKTDAQDSEYAFALSSARSASPRILTKRVLFFAKRLASYTVNKLFLCARGHTFPTVFLRQVGILPFDEI